MNAKFTQRMPEELHSRVESLSNDYGVSMNTLVNMACEEFVKTGKLEELEKRVEELEKQAENNKK